MAVASSEIYPGSDSSLIRSSRTEAVSMNSPFIRDLKPQGRAQTSVQKDDGSVASGNVFGGLKTFHFSGLESF